MSDFEKLLILLSLLIVVVPIALALMRSREKYEYYILFATVFLSTFGDRFGFSLDYDFEYRGTISGYSVQLCDFLYLSLFLKSLPRKISLEGKALFTLYLIYLFFILYSSLASRFNHYDYWKYGIFESIKFLPVLYYYLSAIDKSRIKTVFFAFTAAAAFHGLYFLFERYGLNVHRVSGVFNHPNLVSSIVILLFSPLFYVALCGRDVLGRGQRALVFLATLLVGTGAILTVSRTMVGIFTLTCLLITTIAIIKHYHSSRYYLLFFVIVALGAGIQSFDTFYNTFSLKGFTGGGRMEMNELAIEMANSTVSGVGFNNFSIAASEYGIESLQAAYTGHGLPPVHNVYLLAFAEIGISGLLAYCAFLFFGLLLFLFSRSSKQSVNLVSLFIVGAFIGVCMLYLQAILEDSPRREFVMYILYPMLGLIVSFPRYQRLRLHSKPTQAAG